MIERIERRVRLKDLALHTVEQLNLERACDQMRSGGGMTFSNVCQGKWYLPPPAEIGRLYEQGCRQVSTNCT